MTTFLQLLVSGLALGAAYALTALGFVVIYRASQVFNFAQGELLTFGAFIMTTFLALGLPWVAALVLAMVATGTLAAAIERGALRALVGRPVFVTIIVTIFIALFLRAGIHIVWQSEVRGMPMPWDTMGTVDLFGAKVLYNSLGAIACAALALAGFFAVIKYSKLGVAMRATSSDQEVALALGIPVGRVFAATWFLSGAYAALAGVFLCTFPNSLDANLGFIALAAFPAVIVGGLDSPLGTVIAGVMLGVLEMLSQGYVNPRLGDFGHNFHQVFPYVVMILFLMFRPYGLMGTREVERV